MKARVLVPFLAVLLSAALVHAQGAPPEGGAPPAAAPPAAAPPAAAPPAAAPPATPPPAAAPKPKVAERIKGLLIIGGFGVDGCTDNFCDPGGGALSQDPLVYIRVQALYRFLKYIAAGLHIAFPFSYADNEPSGYDVTFWNVMLGAEVRGIFPWRKLDFWTGLVFGYWRWQGDGENGQSLSSWFDTFALGWGFGADYYITPRIGLGLTFYLYKPFPDQMCDDPAMPGADKCNDLTSDAKDDIGIWWSLGFAFTYFLPM
jgi:hypothetical protein